MSRFEVTRNAYFENIYENIISELLNAKISVKICVAWINAPMLRETIEELKNKRVNLEIIYDDNMSNLDLKKINSVALYPISMDGSAFMHNKFCVIDDEILITGSFNWTRNAARSFENLIIIKRDYGLIKDYLHEFEDLKNYSILSQTKRHKRSFHPDGSRCNSICYDVGVFGYYNDENSSQEISIWNICNAHQIAVCIKSMVIVDDPDDESSDMQENSDVDWFVSRDRMLDEFKLERNILDAPTGYFLGKLRTEVQAYGYVRIKDEAEHIKYGFDPEYFLEFKWRNVFWRKIIPLRLFEYDGDIDDLIERHRPGATSIRQW